VRRYRILLYAVLIASAVALGVVVSGRGPTPKSTLTPSSSSYSPATTRTISKLAELQRLARSQVVANEDSAVHAGLIVMTTREQAAGGDVVNSDQPVYLLIIGGHFTCGSCSTTPRAKAPTGTFITLTVDRSTLATTDFGIVHVRPVIPAAARVYSFSF